MPKIKKNHLKQVVYVLVTMLLQATSFTFTPLYFFEKSIDKHCPLHYREAQIRLTLEHSKYLVMHESVVCSLWLRTLSKCVSYIYRCNNNCKNYFWTIKKTYLLIFGNNFVIIETFKDHNKQFDIKINKLPSPAARDLCLSLVTSFVNTSRRQRVSALSLWVFLFPSACVVTVVYVFLFFEISNFFVFVWFSWF